MDKLDYIAALSYLEELPKEILVQGFFNLYCGSDKISELRKLSKDGLIDLIIWDFDDEDSEGRSPSIVIEDYFNNFIEGYEK